MKKIIALFGVVLVIAIIYARDYFAVGQESAAQWRAPNTSSLSGSPDRKLPSSYQVETVAEGLQVPWAIAFTSDERILVTERAGTVRAVVDKKVQAEPLLTLPVAAQAESGLMGMTLDPDYQTNKLLYLCYTYQNGESLANRVISVKDEETKLTIQKTMIENVPSARFHAGCELAIGPDQKLYISFGDATQKSLAQDKTSLAGKILRLNLDGSVPSDNPMSNSPVWSLGHRNPQGMTWNPTNQVMYSVEHGPSGNDGPLGGDEINSIQKNGNYGWPEVSHEKNEDGFIAPMITFTPAVAPASAQFYNGDRYPELDNSLIFATLRGNALYRAVMKTDNPTELEAYDKLSLPALGRLREVIQGPDGYLYFTTSNTDGRGSPQTGDDKILRILPS